MCVMIAWFLCASSGDEGNSLPSALRFNTYTSFVLNISLSYRPAALSQWTHFSTLHISIASSDSKGDLRSEHTTSSLGVNSQELTRDDTSIESACAHWKTQQSLPGTCLSVDLLEQALEMRCGVHHKLNNRQSTRIRR